MPVDVKARVEEGKLALIRQLMDAKLKRSAAKRQPKEEPPAEAAPEEKKEGDELAEDDAESLRRMYEQLK